MIYIYIYHICIYIYICILSQNGHSLITPTKRSLPGERLLNGRAVARMRWRPRSGRLARGTVKDCWKSRRNVSLRRPRLGLFSEVGSFWITLDGFFGLALDCPPKKNARIHNDTYIYIYTGCFIQSALTSDGSSTESPHWNRNRVFQYMSIYSMHIYIYIYIHTYIYTYPHGTSKHFQSNPKETWFHSKTLSITKRGTRVRIS